MKLRKTISIKMEDIVIIILVMIVLLTYIFIKIFTEKSKIVLLEYAKNKSIELSTLIINESIKETLLEETTNDILKIEKNENNEIISVDFDNSKTNKILYEVNESMLNYIKRIENTENINENSKIKNKYFNKENMIYNVPFNVINEKTILVGIGPRIPFKLEIISSATNSISTNIKEYGINNSIVELQLEIEISVQIIIPFTSQRTTINKQLPISTKIIQGKIPEYYGGMISART